MSICGKIRVLALKYLAIYPLIIDTKPFEWYHKITKFREAEKMKKLIKITSVILLIAAAFCLLYFIYLSIYKGFDDIIVFFWPIAVAVFGVAAFLGLFSLKRGKILKAVSLVLVAAILGFVISFSVFAINLSVIAGEKPPENAECIIVLGAAVHGDRPSRALRQRIDAAYTYLSENPDTVAVCTGGTGPNDAISEGGCIARELEKMGIEKERLFVEDKSESTRENFQFAFEVLGYEPENVVIISNGFHLRRARLILSEDYTGEIYTLAAKTDIFIIHYTVREYIIRFLRME